VCAKGCRWWRGTSANQDWAIDFAHDAVASGRAIRVLSVVEAYTRECLALEVDTSFAHPGTTTCGIPARAAASSPLGPAEKTPPQS
jgi:hypothetical protein